MTSGIYSITAPSGNCYIGSSINIEARWQRHRWDLKKGTHHALKLQRAYTKYECKEFKFLVLDECTEGSLLALEQMYLTRYEPKYNTTLAIGIASCEQARKKMTTTIRTPEHRAKVRAIAIKLKTHTRLHTEVARATNNAWHRQSEVREMYRKNALTRDYGSRLIQTEVIAKSLSSRQTFEFRARATEQFRDAMLPVHCAGCMVKYESIAQAARSVGIPAGNIRRSALTGCKAGGYIWVFTKIDIVLY
jgi:group I intron endonuclease